MDGLLSRFYMIKLFNFENIDSIVMLIVSLSILKIFLCHEYLGSNLKHFWKIIIFALGLAAYIGVMIYLEVYQDIFNLLVLLIVVVVATIEIYFKKPIINDFVLIFAIATISFITVPISLKFLSDPAKFVSFDIVLSIVFITCTILKIIYYKKQSHSIVK